MKKLLIELIKTKKFSGTITVQDIETISPVLNWLFLNQPGSVYVCDTGAYVNCKTVEVSFDGNSEICVKGYSILKNGSVSKVASLMPADGEFVMWEGM